MEIPSEFGHLREDSSIPWERIVSEANSRREKNYFIAFTDVAIEFARKESMKKRPREGVVILGIEAALTRGRLADVLFLSDSSDSIAVLSLRAIALFVISDTEGLRHVLETVEAKVSDESPVTDRVRVSTVRILLAAVERDTSVIMCIMEFDNLLDNYPEQVEQPLTETMFALYVVGTLLKEVGEVGKASRLADTLETMTESKGHRMLTALVENLRGNIANYLGEYSRAEEHYLRCREISQEYGFSLGVGMALNNMGSLMIAVFRLEEALEYLREALKYMDIETPRLTTLVNLGEIATLLGKTDEAREYFEEAVRIEKKLQKGVVETYTLYCSLLCRLGEMDKARKMLSEAAKIAEKSEKPIKRCSYLLSLALFNASNGGYAEARKALDEMLTIAREQKVFEMVVRAIIETARVYMSEFEATGNRQLISQAMQYLDDLTQIAKEQDLPSLRARALMLKGELHRLTGGVLQAKGYLERALSIARFRDDAMLEAQIRESLETLGGAEEEDVEESVMSSMDRISVFRTHGRYREVATPTLHALITIIRESGLTEFVHYFDSSLEMDSSIIAGFITAIAAFSSKLMESTGNLRTISHEGFTIMMEHTERRTVALIATEETYEIRYRLRKFAKEFDEKFPLPEGDVIETKVYEAATEMVNQSFTDLIVA